MARPELCRPYSLGVSLEGKASTVVYMSEERYMSEETHTEKLVLAVTKTYDYCDMSQETLK